MRTLERKGSLQGSHQGSSATLVYPTRLENVQKTFHPTCLFGPTHLRNFSKTSNPLVYLGLLVYLAPESNI